MYNNDDSLQSMDHLISIKEELDIELSNHAVSGEDSENFSSVSIAKFADINKDVPTFSGYEPPPPKKTKKWARRYNNDYLKYGFISYGLKDEIAKPQCVVCSEVLANESLKPSKLKRHLESKHAVFANKSLDFFEAKKQELLLSSQFFNKPNTPNDKAQLASYLASYQIAKATMDYTIGEELILPCIIDLIRTMFDYKATEKIKSVPLDEETIHQNVTSIADYQENNLITRILYAGDYSIQIDEISDISNCTKFLVYVKYVWESDFMEDLLYYMSLPPKPAGVLIFTALQECLVEKYKLDWGDCKGITTNGVSDITGKDSDLMKHIARKINHTPWNHCFIDQVTLISNTIPSHLSSIFFDVINMVNIVKQSPLHSRFMEIFHNEMGDQTHLLSNTQNRWLSRGNILSRFYELREDIRFYLIDEEPKLASLLTNNSWTMSLAYLTDIFHIFNDLHVKLHAANNDLFKHWEQVQALQKSLQLWQARIKSNTSNFYMFPKLSKYTNDKNIIKNDLEGLKQDIELHLATLSETFDNLYPQNKFEILKRNSWAKDPFCFESPESVIDLNLTPEEETELLQLTCDVTLRNRHKSMNLSAFWIAAKKKYPLLSTKAILMLLPFTTTQICEEGFSTFIKLQIKERDSSHTASDLRIALSPISPNWSDIMKNWQTHTAAE